MTEQEWMIVARAFTSLFDIVKEKAPDRIQIDRVFTAGRILAMEIKRIQASQVFFSTTAVVTDDTRWRFETADQLQKRNEELEKKKQAQREELSDLTDTLKASIEKTEKDRQGE